MRWIAGVAIGLGLIFGLIVVWFCFAGSGLMTMRALKTYDPPAEYFTRGDACHGSLKVLPRPELESLFPALYVAESNLHTRLASIYPCYEPENKDYIRGLQELNDSARIRLSFRNVELSTMYLNLIYFGEGQWGAAAGSEHYLGVMPSQLTVSQAALLIALAKAPAFYSPSRHPERALARRNMIITGELKRLSISEQEAREAIAAPLGK